MTGSDEEEKIDPTEESWWKLGPWLAVFALGGLVGGLVACWIAGLLGAIALGEPFGYDLIGYHEPETAGAEDHIRYVAIGAAILVLAWGGYTGFERLTDWLDHRRWRRENDSRDLARYRREEAEREEAKARRKSEHFD